MLSIFWGSGRISVCYILRPHFECQYDASAMDFILDIAQNTRKYSTPT